jgi:hypothetical protein
MTLQSLPGRAARGLLLSLALAYGANAGAVDARPGTYLVMEAAEEAFWWGDFASLEQWNDRYRKGVAVDATGASSLDQFRTGLNRVFQQDVKNAEPYLSELDMMTLQWARDHPRSGFAHALHAASLVRHGWSYRGGGTAKDVPPEAWTDFRRYLERASAYLQEHAEAAFTDSYAHSVLFSIGQGLGWDRARMAAIAEEGRKRNPDDIALVFQMVDYLLPKWGGDAKSLDDYINRVTEATRGKYGTGMYARLYGVALEDYGNTLFEASLADWGKIKTSYDDMFARYPDSPYRRNRYAFMACIAKDKPTLTRLLAEIGTQVRLDAWGGNPSRALETCRKWASQS